MLRVELSRKISLDDYASIVGENQVEVVKSLGEKLKGKSVTHVNSTSFGGGVAEICSVLFLFMRDGGLDEHWRSLTEL
jgi:trehalose synthase